MTILDQLADHARERVAAAKAALPLADLRRQAEALPKGDFAFEKAIRKPGMSFICECKKASPSKGLIAPDFPYLEIAKAYEAAGADCVSVLTEPKWFKGDIAYLKKVAQEVKIPVLRKDFIIDRCQIDEAALAGASAILLIAAILSDEEIREFLSYARSLGLGVLAEAHDEKEMERMLGAGARIVGVNNRDLRDFTIHLENTEHLARLVPKDRILVSESGMMSEAIVKQMREAGADAVLIGEMLMRAGERRGNVIRTLRKENQ